MTQYMISIELPDDLDQDFISLIPEQRAMVDRLMVNGVVLNYSLNQDRTKLWVTLLAKNRTEAVSILRSFPIYEYLNYEIHELAFYNSPAFGIPAISLN